jgi:flagellar hook assembly protein FlgD
MVKITTALSGKVIRTLTESNGGVNGTQAFWDGRDENNQFVPSGVYIIAAGRSKAGSGIVKIAIIRR